MFAQVGMYLPGVFYAGGTNKTVKHKNNDERSSKKGEFPVSRIVLTFLLFWSHSFHLNTKQAFEKCKNGKRTAYNKRRQEAFHYSP